MFRPLHYVFRLGDRKNIKEFFINVLDMKILRHEEFKEGCEATCNGPYDGKWSKTMIGYGDEINHFVIELTYNYGISSYKTSNDLKYIKIHSTKVLSNVKQAAYEKIKIADNPETLSLMSPDGYRFVIVGKDVDKTDPLSEVCLAVKDLTETTDYYTTILPGILHSQTKSSSIIKFDDYQFRLVLEMVKDDIVKTTASGRIAFSYQNEVASIEKRAKEKGRKVKTSLVTLETPGKASVDVVILLDPDEHEICVVGDYGFRELSKIDPLANQLLDTAIQNDKSDEWFAKKGGKKAHND